MASLAAYIRVSAVRGREGDSFISPELQREHCKRFADAHGHTILAWFEDIATHLNASGSKPRRANQWSARAVKDLVVNEVYLGVARKGKLRNETAHEPLLTKPQWLAAQDVFDKGSTPHTGGGYALTGLVRCAGCSRIMSSARYKPKGKEPVLQYQCVGHSGAGDCPARANVNEARLAPFVEAAVSEPVKRFEALVGGV